MWSHKNTYAIGGLENVGYADNSDNLIVLSSQGRGVFSCVTGEKIDRDSLDWWSQFDESTSAIRGFGLLAGAIIKTSGLYGKYFLPTETNDGWTLIKRENEVDDPPFEKYRVTKIFLTSPNNEKIIFISKDGPCELRSFGFSPTGNSFVVALSCELAIWSRD
ncbi:hypothetical protein [Chitinophaga sp.]|uniref:hypothetical protein n=1 Tax=Chitinophaga sp. TaxID=1869181 RepID=UPI0031D0303D